MEHPTTLPNQYANVYLMYLVAHMNRQYRLSCPEAMFQRTSILKGTTLFILELRMHSYVIVLAKTAESKPCFPTGQCYQASVVADIWKFWYSRSQITVHCQFLLRNYKDMFYYAHVRFKPL